MNKKAPLLLLWLFFILLPALGQERPAPPPPPQQTAGDIDDIVKITTNLVQVDVVVTKGGKHVTNLTADDFEIFEDGRRQTITSFAYISNVPATAPQPANTDKKSSASAVPYAPIKRDDPHRTMAFVVDDLGLSFESMGQVKNQLRKFIAEQLQPNDLVAILRTSGELGALQQFTNDKRLLNRAVDHLRWHFCSRVGMTVFRPVRQYASDGQALCGLGSYGNTMASLRFIVDSMGYLPGRKSMVLMSDSVPRESLETFADLSRGTLREDSLSMGPYTTDQSRALDLIAEKAIRASVVIYSVDTQGLQTMGIHAADVFTGGPDEWRNLMHSRTKTMMMRREGGDSLAKETGGFQIRNSNFFELERIMEDQSGYYLLGYRPSEETFNRRIHKIKAKVKRSGMNVRTRFGFFGVSEEESNRAKPTAREQTNMALASPFMAQDVNLDMTSFFIHDNKLGSIVRSFIYIDGKDLTLTGVNGRYQGSIELHGVVFGDNGVVVEQVTRGATLSLPESDYQHARSQGVRLSFDIPVKRAGAFQVRVAARDRPSSRIGSAGQFVLVPDLKKKQMAVSGIVLAENGADQSITNAGTRRFAPKAELYFAYMLYNAANESGKLRNLVMDVKLFRDDKNVHSGPQTPIVASDQAADPSRVAVNGVLRLAPELEPGNYYLQITITDKDAPAKKVAPVIQWVDFEIVK
ncbi:MAG TPA: VWA domain-containing protein [Pyrinomonadaceae bacterium]